MAPTTATLQASPRRRTLKVRPARRTRDPRPLTDRMEHSRGHLGGPAFVKAAHRLARETVQRWGGTYAEAYRGAAWWLANPEPESFDLCG